MTRRTLATIKTDLWELADDRNRHWLVKALRQIADEYEAGQHTTDAVLEIFEDEALFDTRRRWANS